MSRVGRKPVTLPAGVEVKVDGKNLVTVKGPKGQCGLPGRDGRRGISARGDASSPYPRGSPPPRPGRPRAGRHRLRRRERPSRRPRRRRPPPPSRAAARRPAAGRGRPWRCCCPTAGSAFPTRSWGSPRTTRPRARAQSSPSWAGGVVGLGRVPTGPGVAFLSALGKPGHFSAADVIRRPLGDPCGRALRRLLFERGEMRLARHELPYGRHSPRHPVMGPVTLPCGRRLAPGENSSTCIKDIYFRITYTDDTTYSDRKSVV